MYPAYPKYYSRSIDPFTLAVQASCIIFYLLALFALLYALFLGVTTNVIYAILIYFAVKLLAVTDLFIRTFNRIKQTELIAIFYLFTVVCDFALNLVAIGYVIETRDVRTPYFIAYEMLEWAFYAFIVVAWTDIWRGNNE